MYVKRITTRRSPPRRSFLGLGAFTDNDQCSTIPLTDPYRKPGNYCATPDGGIVTFNADHTVVRTPGALDPDPAHPASVGGGFFDKILSTFGVGTPTGPLAPAPQVGMSTTTKIALAGGVVVAAYLIARRR